MTFITRVAGRHCSLVVEAGPFGPAEHEELRRFFAREDLPDPGGLLIELGPEVVLEECSHESLRGHIRFIGGFGEAFGLRVAVRPRRSMPFGTQQKVVRVAIEEGVVVKFFRGIAEARAWLEGAPQA